MHLLAIVFFAIAVVVSLTKAAPSDQPNSSGSSLSTIEKRTCYINGESWGDDIETANSLMHDLCKNTFPGKYISGTISSSKWACRNISPIGGDHKKQMILYLSYIGNDDSREIAYDECVGDHKKQMILYLSYIGNDDSREIAYDECVSGFSKEINGCARGGARSYWNWKYRADPNHGLCS